MRRTIMIFPQFSNIDIINNIRKKYDPLEKHVRPHITLVFTFETNLDKDIIRNYLKSILSQIKPFNLSMKKIVKEDNELGKYLFLTIDEGLNEIKNLSKLLYKGILKEYKPIWLNEDTFIPHMTIGNFTSSEELEYAFKDVLSSTNETFLTEVNTISVEIIDENEDSIVDIEEKLGENV